MESTTMTIAEALRQAVAAHRAGRLQEAEGLYLAILQADPRQPDANHNLGVLAVQVGKPEAGLPYLKTAVAALPSQAQYWQSYVDALLATRRFDTARAVLEDGRNHGLGQEIVAVLATRLAAASPHGGATAAAPQERRHPGGKGRTAAKAKRGRKDGGRVARCSRPVHAANEAADPSRQRDKADIVTLFKQGLYAQAGQRCRAYIAAYPEDAFGRKALGTVLLQCGQYEAAAGVLAEAAAMPGEDAQLNNNYGKALQATGQDEAAVLQYTKALALKPDYAEACNNLGNALKALGRPAEAVRHYEKALTCKPDFAEACNNIGIVLQESGRFDAAIAQYEKALGLKPDYADALNNLGNVLMRLGRLSEAEARYRQALAIAPEAVGVRNNLGNALRGLGRLDEALAAYRETLRLQPDFYETQYNMADTLKSLGQLDEAISLYEGVLQRRPDFVAAYNGLGNAVQLLDRFDDAIGYYNKALAIDPDYADAHNNVGSALQEVGRFDAALAHYEQALRIRPDYPEAYNNMGNCLKLLGRLGEAVAHYEQALSLRPDYAEALNNLGNALKDMGRVDEAVVCYGKALDIKPAFAEVHYNLGNSLKYLGRMDEAIDRYQEALVHNQDYAEVYNNMANAFKDLARFDEAFQCYEKTLELRPQCADFFSNYLFARNLVPNTQAALFQEYQRFSDRFERPLRGTRVPHANVAQPDRPLRIGYVSGDFCVHALSHFIGRVLACHDAGSHVVHCYQTSTKYDAVSEAMRGYVARWRSLVGLSDDAAADMIRADGIDILVDLSGHTAGNRLLVFARKPAPVQVTWLGFLNTTGLESMDYILCNRWLVRPEDVPYCSETPWYFDGPSSCFDNEALRGSVPVGPLPAWNNGWVTFGSFNQYCKINRHVVDCWVRILRSVPESRLYCKAKVFNSASVCAAFAERFQRHGIDASRLVLEGGSSMRDFLLAHHEVDIALDSFPYNGGTITCHSLSMGVPVLTLKGQSVISHVGESFLRPLGLDDWVADGEDDYVVKAVAWAGRLDELGALRQTLRQRFARTYGDAAGFTRRLEAAYRGMWERWCAERAGH